MGATEGTTHPMRRQIYDAAMDCFVRSGFAETSVEDIADAAGVSRMTVFRHFGRKDDIVFAGSYRRLSRFRSQLQDRHPVSLGDLHDCMAAFADTLAAEADFGRWMAVIDGDRDLLARAGLLRWDLESEVATAVTHGHGAAAPSLPVRVLAANTTGALFMAARTMWDTRGDFGVLAREALTAAGVPPGAGALLPS